MNKKKATTSEDKLFERAPLAVRKLHAQARDEKRQRERAEWWNKNNPAKA